MRSRRVEGAGKDNIFKVDESMRARHAPVVLEAHRVGKGFPERCEDVEAFSVGPPGSVA